PTGPGAPVQGPPARPAGDAPGSSTPTPQGPGSAVPGGGKVRPGATGYSPLGSRDRDEGR
ncbi:MAG: hypothetical protein Q7T67_14305, partial [Patulibacter sp.]